MLVLPMLTNPSLFSDVKTTDSYVIRGIRCVYRPDLVEFLKGDSLSETFIT
jgi:hypothetical protein